MVQVNNTKSSFKPKTTSNKKVISESKPAKVRIDERDKVMANPVLRTAPIEIKNAVLKEVGHESYEALIALEQYIEDSAKEVAELQLSLTLEPLKVI